MHKLGYTEGRNIVIEYRVAEGRDERQVIENHISGDRRIELYFRVVGLIACFVALSKQIGA